MLYFLFYSIKKIIKNKIKKEPPNALVMHVERQVNVNIIEE
jgi:hypothetical protein